MSPTKISKNSFSLYSLNCIALGLCSCSIQGTLEAFSISWEHCDLKGFPITPPGASSQNIFLKPLPLVPPGVCETDPPGHSKVNDGTNSAQHSTKGKTKAQGEVRQVRCDDSSFSVR